MVHVYDHDVPVVERLRTLKRAAQAPGNFGRKALQRRSNGSGLLIIKTPKAIPG